MQESVKSPVIETENGSVFDSVDGIDGEFSHWIQTDVLTDLDPSFS